MECAVFERLEATSFYKLHHIVQQVRGTKWTRGLIRVKRPPGESISDFELQENVVLEGIRGN